MSELMEAIPITIALTGNSPWEIRTLFQKLDSRHWHVNGPDNWLLSDCSQSPVTGSYTYMEQTFRLVCRTFDSLLSNETLQPPDVLAVGCNAAFLERGLFLLARILSSCRFSERPIPMVLCVMDCDRAKRNGILIDFDLLEDVLQIPVIPLDSRISSGYDDLKAAVAYVHAHPPLYDCLDFSPERLADEIIRWPQGTAASREYLSNSTHTDFVTGSILPLFFLFLLLWLTFSGAGLLREPVFHALSRLEHLLFSMLTAVHAPVPLMQFLFCGILYPILWVIAVMLPPLLIFLPLFSLMEDAGFLSHAAFRADPFFSSWGGCGMQCSAITMGLCCHTAAVLECRKIASPRERMAAALTVPFLPCSGRMTMLLSLIPFFTSVGAECDLHPAVNAAVCIGFLLLGAAFSLGAALLLSRTSLQHFPSFFALELEPCRRPRIFQQVLPAALERLSFLLGRAALFSIPAGILIWFLSSREVGGISLLARCISLLTPIACLLGLDGTILTAFLLGIPANEIILPLTASIYSAEACFGAVYHSAHFRSIFLANGWTWKTACSAILFTLFQCPCLSSLFTIHKETGSIRWTIAAAWLPVLCGLGLCFLTACIWRFFF
ncbi:MAG: nucleoside recognition domain-containing protein [Lachnospiraceae bacterium]|nr:nucleoside recognition domain-containing protein [Lachnospiraceae bacterium]